MNQPNMGGYGAGNYVPPNPRGPMISTNIPNRPYNPSYNPSYNPNSYSYPNQPPTYYTPPVSTNYNAL